ncbi:MAG TPA: FkbM family methyltransferase [Opitutaceae bacterium]|nr:FkbM family methyltransferase [Opitutaceae bacterium]
METSLKKGAVRLLHRLSPATLLWLARRYPYERGRWPALKALLDSEAGRSWLGSLEEPTRTRRGFGVFTLGGDLTSDWIKLFGQHEVATEKFIADHARPGSVMLDIGANVGYFSLLAAHLGASAVAFEPQPAIAELLRKSAAANGFEARVRVEEIALSDSSTTMGMTACPGNTGHSQLVGADAPGALPFTVKVEPLDEWISRNPTGPVSVCKIDTEGAELNVITGMKHLLERDGPALAVECVEEFQAEFGSSSPTVAGLLANSGYMEVTSRYVTHGDRNRYFTRRPPA